MSYEPRADLMTPRERVSLTLQRREPDRVPMGELVLDPQLIAQVLEELEGDPWEQTRRFTASLGLDLVVCGLDEPPHYPFALPPASCGDIQELLDRVELPSTEGGALSQVRRWSQQTELFVFALVGGGLGPLCALMGFGQALMACVSSSREARALVRRLAGQNAVLARRAVGAGAQAVIIGDDLAYNDGTFLSPAQLREVVFPGIEEEVGQIGEMGVPVFFHSDGRLHAILDDLVALGIHGLHSLQPSAGMEIGAIKRKYGDRLCLMGNLDLHLLSSSATREEVERTVRETLRVAAPGGGYIFSTSGGLGPGLDPRNVRTMYRAALRFGRYPRSQGSGHPGLP